MEEEKILKFRACLSLFVDCIETIPVKFHESKKAVKMQDCIDGLIETIYPELSFEEKSNLYIFIKDDNNSRIINSITRFILNSTSGDKFSAKDFGVNQYADFVQGVKDFSRYSSWCFNE